MIITDIFSNFCWKLRLFILVRTATGGSFNEYSQPVILYQKKNNNAYPCKPHSPYIKWGFPGFSWNKN